METTHTKQNNFAKFCEIYEKNLRKNVVERPAEYGYDSSKVPEVMNRMRMALQNNTYSKETTTFKDTCKELGIKHTYMAINEFISKIAE